MCLYIVLEHAEKKTEQEQESMLPEALSMAIRYSGFIVLTHKGGLEVEGSTAVRSIISQLCSPTNSALILYLKLYCTSSLFFLSFNLSLRKLGFLDLPHYPHLHFNLRVLNSSFNSLSVSSSFGIKYTLCISIL